MYIKNLLLVFWAIFGLVGNSFANEADEIQTVQKAFNKLMAGSRAEAVVPSPVDGLYEVTYQGQIYYMTTDTRHIIQGDIIDVASRTNLTGPRRDQIRVNTVNEIGEENMIIFSPKQVEHTVTVFTDIDCGYCRKLHKEVGAYNEKGIEVRYLFFPRSGPDTPSFKKAVSVWCSDDRNSALTSAKGGKNPAKKECVNPVRDHYDTGQRVGVSGTPAIILEDGRLIPGYISATRMAKLLNGAGEER